MIIDCHTHTPRPDAIVNIGPDGKPLLPYSYSVGIHPWDAAKATDTDMERICSLAESPNVIAIGETGLDAIHRDSLPRQEELFRRHIDLSERLHKPLILHVVRSIDDILAIHKETHPTQAWIIHGFRGKPQQARQLTKAGLYLSFGERFNPESITSTPPEQRLIETDTSNLPIETIAANTGISPALAASNLTSVLNRQNVSTP